MMQKQGSQRTVLQNQGLVYYHATLVEAVLVMVFATFIFWFIFLVADLGIIKVMSYHSAYVMGRSHIVGFEHDITRRAMNVGAIPISGILKRPNSRDLGIRSQVDLALLDPYLISQYIEDRPPSAASANGDVMEYQHWNKLIRSIPGSDGIEQVERFGVTFRIEFAKEDYLTSNENGGNNYLDMNGNDIIDDPWYGAGSNDEFGADVVSNPTIPDRHRISLIPGIWYFIPGGRLDIHGETKFLNHAAYYMQ